MSPSCPLCRANVGVEISPLLLPQSTRTEQLHAAYIHRAPGRVSTARTPGMHGRAMLQSPSSRVGGLRDSIEGEHRERQLARQRRLQRERRMEVRGDPPLEVLLGRAAASQAASID